MKKIKVKFIAFSGLQEGEIVDLYETVDEVLKSGFTLLESQIQQMNDRGFVGLVQKPGEQYLTSVMESIDEFEIIEETKQKKKSVRRVTYEVYLLMTKEFAANDLITNVRLKLGRPYLRDGTILRRLRELRSNGLLNYKVIDHAKSIYYKK